MFSKQFKAVFYVLAQAFTKLYHMSESWTPADDDDTHVEMTGQEFIDQVDLPDAGLADAVDVFTTKPAPAQISAAQVFGGAPVPVYEMIEPAAAGFSREAYHANGWDDAMLIEKNMMREVVAAPKPPAAAPTPPAAVTPTPDATNTAAPLLDTTGLRWDARIHSSTRTTTEAGVWKKRKNVNDAEVARVTAELRQAGGAPVAQNFTPLAATAPAPAAPAPVAPPAAPAAPAPVAAPPAPAAPGITSPANAVAAAKTAANATVTNPTTFTEVCKWITQNGFTMVDLATACKVYGMNSAGELARPEYAPLIPQVAADVAATRK